MYMPDLGRWGVMDAMSEKYRRHSPYNYGVNNPIMFTDPDGNDVQTFSGAAAQQAFINYRDSMSNTESSGNNYFSNFNFDRFGDGNPKPNFWERVGNFFDGIFNNNKGAGISTFLPGATISRGVYVGLVIPDGVAAETVTSTLLNFNTALASITRVGLWSLPLMLNGDSSHARGYDIPLTSATDEPADDPDQKIILYRGVCVGHYDYKNAIKGMAVPLGGHNDPDSHNWGDTESVFTSWTTNINTALKFANKNGSGGVLLSKDFSIKETIPSPDKYNEQEILIRGTVVGAFPFIQTK